jgi:hypothetical protein
MEKSINMKKVRALVVTVALIAVANFAISHAESISTLTANKGKALSLSIQQYRSHASSEGSYPIGPRPVNTFASSEGSYPIGPRPVNTFASSEGSYPIGPRPVNTFASSEGSYPIGPRPVRF